MDFSDHCAETNFSLFCIKVYIRSGIFFLLPTYFYSGTLLTFQHICNSYCQHHSCSQNVYRTRGIITPPHHCAFRPTTLSYTTPVQLAYIPCPLTSHCKRVQGRRSLWFEPTPTEVDCELNAAPWRLGQPDML